MFDVKDIPDRRIAADEVAKMYGVEEKTIWNWLAAGAIPCPIVQRHKYTRWLLSEILADIRSSDHAEKEEAAT